MTHVRSPGRRVFLSDLGKGTLAIAVFGFVASACSSDETVPTGGATVAFGTTTSIVGTTSIQEVPETTTSTPESAPEGTGVTIQRVNLGFVSAYVLARGGEAAVVDTGVSGSAPAIAEGLAAAGLGWESVGHVILTHLHPDHIGSLAEVLANAPEATAYAGEADISGIASPRALVPVEDGDAVFGLQIISTPGHTAGHICVLDPIGGVLVAGDALNGSEGGVSGPNPQFTDDLNLAIESVRKLAGLSFDKLMFGHGDPIERDASTAVAGLAANL